MEARSRAELEHNVYDGVERLREGLGDAVDPPRYVALHPNLSRSWRDPRTLISANGHNALLMTPPSTRNAAPVVAEASGLAT
jgi:hypothetical protein